MTAEIKRTYPAGSPSGDARADAGIPEDRNAYANAALSQSPLSGNPPAALTHRCASTELQDRLQLKLF